jgi:hypothetical protein
MISRMMAGRWKVEEGLKLTIVAARLSLKRLCFGFCSQETADTFAF